MVRELHVAKNIDELQSFCKLSSDVKYRKIHQLCNSLDTVLNEAERNHRSGDEEQEYIFYMKYFNLVDVIKKHRDFNKKLSNTIAKGGDIKHRMDILEKLHANLLRRYGEEEGEKKEEKPNTNMKPEHNNNEKIRAEIAYSTTKSPNSTCFISCSELYKRLSDPLILLMDCRSHENFNDSKIRCENQINIPEHRIKNGISASYLEPKAANDQILWKQRGQMDLVVLIDEDSSATQPIDPSKPIQLMMVILKEWDPYNEYKSILMLDGGFQNFVCTYPMKTTNPKYSRKLEIPELYPSLQDIEYPSTDHIKMKPNLTEKQKYRPRYDRANKPQRWSKSTESNKNPVENARERELEIDIILEKEKELSNIVNEFRNEFTKQVNNTDQTEWINKQTELEYKLIQKENELNDTIQRYDTVNQHEFEDKFGTIQIEQTPELATIKATIEAKERQISQYEQKRSETKPDLEEKIKLVKERQKRQLETNVNDEIRPKMPAFDRSSKPTFGLDYSVKPIIQRDFSPVYGQWGEHGATGLKNLGNTCYMNSIIQCILNQIQFCEYLKTDKYQKHINRKSKTHGQVTEELSQLCKELWSGKFKSISPRDFRSVIGKQNGMFATYDQQDSHEFLLFLIDILHSELEFPLDDRFISDKITKPEDVAWFEFLKYKQSIIQRLYFGQTRSTVKCCTCGYESARYEGFSHLSLELPQNNEQWSLYDCMDLYFNGETIDGWDCEKCKQSRRAIKKLDISKLPFVLVIHLMRFKASMTSHNSYEKKQNFVHFPISNFNISDYVLPSKRKHNDESHSFDLFAVSNHYGTINRGHYTAYCQNHNSKRWYKFDDNYVTPISSDDVSSSAGYILFYTSA